MTVNTVDPGIKKPLKKKGEIPKELIYEMRAGSPIYYRNYDKVLSGEKTPEEVMGSSSLHGWLLYVIVKFLAKVLDEEKYTVLAGEVGYKFAPKSWYNLDIAVCEKEKLSELKGSYLEVPPKIVFEIDTKADLRKFENPQEYFHKKTQDLLDSGVEKVVWIFTKEKKLWFAEKEKPWLIVDWDYDLEILGNITFNLSKLLNREKVKAE